MSYSVGHRARHDDLHNHLRRCLGGHRCRHVLGGNQTCVVVALVFTGIPAALSASAVLGACTVPGVEHWVIKFTVNKAHNQRSRKKEKTISVEMHFFLI